MLMASKTRKLCYEGQQLIVALIKMFEFDHKIGEFNEFDNHLLCLCR